MNYRYFHDANGKTLYRHHDVPEVFAKEERGKLVGWALRLKIDIIRADNWIDSSRHWHFATFEIADQFFDSLRYSRGNALSHFMERNSGLRRSANIEEIDESRYDQLKVAYSAGSQ